jgi:16S rRNA (uracil1498-N3)-methyltransferase
MCVAMRKKANQGEGGAAHRSLPRLYVETPLRAGGPVECTASQVNYLGNVLRLGMGDKLLVFNGADGEWLAEIIAMKRGGCLLAAREQLRPQSGGPDIHYLFAPLKKARLDYMAQKATEMGVAALRPVMTRRTNAERVNVERMRANAVEAAEQCGVLRLPEVFEPEKLGEALRGWDGARALIFADEAAALASPLEALAIVPRGPLALLIGPEGGFDPSERELLLSLPFVHAVSLGPRVMRADTAVVAALALINAVLGDWR